jgi:hypothetical protein
MTVLHRVMCDSNEGNDIEGYWLGFDRSKRDLAAIGDALKEGLRVTIYMIDEFEMEAVLRRDEKGEWIGWPVSGTFKYLNGSA